MVCTLGNDTSIRIVNQTFKFQGPTILIQGNLILESVLLLSTIIFISGQIWTQRCGLSASEWIDGHKRNEVNMNIANFICRTPGRGFCPLGGIGPQYALLVTKAEKKGQRIEKLYLEVVWTRASQTLNYNNIQNHVEHSSTPHQRVWERQWTGTGLAG